MRVYVCILCTEFLFVETKKSLIKVFNLGFEIFNCPGGQ